MKKAGSSIPAHQTRRQSPSEGKKRRAPGGMGLSENQSVGVNERRYPSRIHASSRVVYSASMTSIRVVTCRRPFG
jgi:hypothetical protein